ncbi:hypothetical protein HM1_1286 [Heliomicrobium modesticaldum Ice1]|uniref:Uncharacterized protein n=1 Tax=Heliobacterium modesticaldum (strain ATCC 51547 / Ice1) TaxID=498761 RepID=B0TGN0_HELMI|nr:hypothetical protein [Heliomicrobium modesticaldum]ABZ83291.1 hypothetical protein HM1_1286 [Heliomicrobium modesticaldum Ice1]
MTDRDVTEGFPSPSHPLRFVQPGREGASQALSPDEEGQNRQSRAAAWSVDRFRSLSSDEEGQITRESGSEIQSWGDFALQRELHRSSDDDLLT